MNKFRLFIFFLLGLIIATAALSFFLPTQQVIKKSITINAQAAIIYENIVRLENFNKLSVWGLQDSLLQYTMNGKDGTVGAYTTWKGNPEISGEGKIEITGLEKNRKISHAISFSKPQKGFAQSEFDILPTANTVTEVTWVFKLATPRPKNIFNLFFSLDKQMGADFEKGLATLKLVMEANNIEKALQ